MSRAVDPRPTEAAKRSARSSLFDDVQKRSGHGKNPETRREPGACSNGRAPGVSGGAGTSGWAWRIGLAEVPIPELRRLTLKVMRDGRSVTVEVTSDGAGLVSHAGTALLAQVADKLGLTGALSLRSGWPEAASSWS